MLYKLIEASMSQYYLLYTVELNIVTNLMRTVTSKRELWPKKPIFLHKKHENQLPNKKVVLPVAPFFQTGSKLQHFSNMAFKNSYNSS